VFAQALNVRARRNVLRAHQQGETLQPSNVSKCRSIEFRALPAELSLPAQRNDNGPFRASSPTGRDPLQIPALFGIEITHAANEQMHRVFQKFIDLLSNAEDAAGLSEAMAITAAELDLSCFAYLALPRTLDDEPRLISNYPTKWTSHYLRNHYERVDPVVAQALQNPEPFRWGFELPSVSHSLPEQRLLDEARYFGIRFGFTVPIHDGHGPIAALTFASDQRNAAFEDCIEAHPRVLQLMAMYYHAHARRKCTSGPKVKRLPLSPREFECLEWASQGKSAWEIGRILGISRNTAAYYLNNAKEKLGVRTVVQAAMRLAAAKKE
jgi:LuxR family transcriptional regulator, activator of conjugal transfer of Ti plasmids